MGWQQQLGCVPDQRKTKRHTALSPCGALFVLRKPGESVLMGAIKANGERPETVRLWVCRGQQGAAGHGSVEGAQSRGVEHAEGGLECIHVRILHKCRGCLSEGTTVGMGLWSERPKRRTRVCANRIPILALRRKSDRIMDGCVAAWGRWSQHTDVALWASRSHRCVQLQRRTRRPRQNPHRGRDCCPVSGQGRRRPIAASPVKQ